MVSRLPVYHFIRFLVAVSVYLSVFVYLCQYVKKNNSLVLPDFLHALRGS